MTIEQAKKEMESAGLRLAELRETYRKAEAAYRKAGEDYMESYLTELEAGLKNENSKISNAAPSFPVSDTEEVHSDNDDDDNDDALKEAIKDVVEKENEELSEKKEAERPENSKDMGAREARDRIRKMSESDQATELIETFLAENENRVTVTKEAAKYIGGEAVDRITGLDSSEEESGEKSEETTTPEPPSKPTPPAAPAASEKPKAPSAPTPPPKNEETEEEQRVSSPPKPKTPVVDGTTKSESVTLPEGVTEPEGAPECFGNCDVYDSESRKCMMCIFDFECTEAQQAVAEQE